MRINFRTNLDKYYSDWFPMYSNVVINLAKASGVELF